VENQLKFVNNLQLGGNLSGTFQEVDEYREEM
jgi:hypothetical protein